MALMDIGLIGNETVIFKRKFRWTLFLSNDNATEAALNDTGEIWMARLANRPTLNITETEIHHMHERHFISGKPMWDAVNLTIYDVKTVEELGGPGVGESLLHKWLNSAWKISDDYAQSYNFLDMGDHDAEYKRNITLRMYDGHGDVMETWWLIGAWPQVVNWGDLDYSSSETADVAVTVRFDRAEFKAGEGTIRTGGAANV